MPANPILNNLLSKTKIVTKSINQEKSIYNIFFFDKETKKGGSLPCSVISLTLSETNEIPEFPIDSNTFIIDNVKVLPLTISLRLFVEYDKLKEFNELAKLGNVCESGFGIICLHKETYKNMRWTARSFTESSESLNGVTMNMEFRQTTITEAKKAYLDYRKVKKPTSASKVDRGVVQTQKKDKTILKSLIS